MYDTNGYLGFTFAGHHSSEFGLLVVSDGSRYHQTLSPTFNDTTIGAPGKNGNYFFGTQLSTREFNINCAFDEMTTHMRDKIQNWLYPNKIGWLIFDESPYKKYLVKISQNIDFSYLPFTDYRKNKNPFFEQDILKGEFSIFFVSFEEYGVGNENYEIPNITKDKVIDQQLIDSGLIPNNYQNFKNLNIFLPNTTRGIHTTAFPSENFYIYNAGSGEATADFYLSINRARNNNIVFPIEIYNYDDGQTYIINNPLENKNYTQYYIDILGSKKEIWIEGVNSDYRTGKINAGGFYNQYYPIIHHEKPTEILVVTQSKDMKNNAEPLFYPLSYSNSKFLPSDSKELIQYFEEFNQNFSDYIISTKYNSYEVNGVLTPSILYGYLNGENLSINEESIIYLIYPNKFHINRVVDNFTPIYEHTYI